MPFFSFWQRLKNAIKVERTRNTERSYNLRRYQGSISSIDNLEWPRQERPNDAPIIEKSNAHVPMSTLYSSVHHTSMC